MSGAVSRANRLLLVAVAALFALSLLSYRQSVTRADRFERGQKLLPNLDPDKVAAIVVRQGERTATLRRQGERYAVAEVHGYRARNDAVNRVLRDLLELGLEQEVGSGAELAAELELEPVTDSTVEVTLDDQVGKRMVGLRVGKGIEDGAGRYVRLLGDEKAPIYLTSGAVSISSDPETYLDQEIVSVERDRVQRVEGPDFVLERADGGDLALAGVPAGRKEKTSETGGLESLLGNLRFERVLVADDAEVRDLEFRDALRFDLDDGSGYVLSVAEAGERTFVRVAGFHTVSQVAITRDEAEEELARKAEVLSRADEIQEFNDYHGSWVYETSEWTGGKLRLRKRDLLESA